MIIVVGVKLLLKLKRLQSNASKSTSNKLLKKQTRLAIGEPYQVSYDERLENVLRLRSIGERFFDTL